MIDLDALKAQIKRSDEIRNAPWNPPLLPMPVFEDRKELVAEVERLLERAQRAEAEAEHLREALRDVLAALGSIPDDDIARGIDKDLAEKNPRRIYYEYDMEMLRIPLRGCRKDRTYLETQVADLRGALQAALLPLERAADALVPPGRRVEEAAGLVDEAIEAIREELE